MKTKQKSRLSKKTAQRLAVLLSLILALLNSSTYAAQPGKIDTLKIYAELIGDYEFYFEERYSPIKIYLENKMLMGREQGHDPITITPVNLDKFEFTAFNGKEYFRVTFVQDTEGKIVRFILGTEQGDDPAERVLAKPGPGAFDVIELQADLLQLRKAMEANPAIIYQFTAKEKLDRLFDPQYDKIAGPMSIEEFRCKSPHN